MAKIRWQECLEARRNVVKLRRPKLTKWKAWFKIYNEAKWCTASKEWDTEEDATLHALSKFRAWTATEDWTVAPVGVDPNNEGETNE